MTPRAASPNMTSQDVLDFLDVVESFGVRVWLDGGWAVDACLGRQTRPHSDLDIVIEEHDTPTLVGELRRRGFVDVPRDDTRPWNFVLGDASGHEIDFHVVVLDDEGHGIYGPPENGEAYPAEALSGTGTVDGRPLSCTTAYWLVQSHTGHPVDEEDWADVSALCRRFDVPIPPDYSGFLSER